MTRRTRRRQRGGGRLWWVLLGAIAALQGTAATNDAKFGSLVSSWWNEGGIENSRALAKFITDGNYLPSVEWTNPFATEQVSPAAIAPPSETQKDGVEEIVEPFLSVPATKLKNEAKYTGPDGVAFTVASWQPKGSTIEIDTYERGPFSVSRDTQFTPVPSDEEQDAGTRRKQPRKTLRRKKQWTRKRLASR